MKVLLLGDYSNVHATLAEGLRELGHKVVMTSDGDGWKNYPRDIDLSRKGGKGFALVCYFFRLLLIFFHFRGFDVVQLINPIFLPLKAERHLPFYRYLRRFNRRIFMGAFGMDHYWVKAGTDCKTFRYSDFNIGETLRQREDNDIWIREWLNGAKGVLNQQIAQDCDGIISGLYEYHASYFPEYAEKLCYIPFPINVAEAQTIFDFSKIEFVAHRKVRIFIGIQRSRHSYKGTDIMLRAAECLQRELPSEVELVCVENVPFEEYKRLMLSCDVLLDQLYSYTPAMNALQAMAQGLIVVGGAEPEHYALLGCLDLCPIINVLPNETDVYEKLLYLVQHKSEIPRLSHESRQYIERYHDHKKVAQQYLDFWRSGK